MTPMMPRFAKRNSGSGQNGFTLLEVMAALAIIAIVLVSIYRLQLQTLSMSHASRFYTQAPLLAQQKMAEVLQAELAGPSQEEGRYEDPFASYNWQVNIDETESTLLGQTAAALLRIEVRVARDADVADNQRFSLRTYRFVQN